jgi:hypothetical protein
MISFNIAIYRILQGFITNELRFFLIEISQEFLDNLLPVEEMLSDLSFKLIDSSSLNLWTNAFIIDEFAKLILNPHFNLLISWQQDIINLYLDNIDIGLIESLMLG